MTFLFKNYSPKYSITATEDGRVNQEGGFGTDMASDQGRGIFSKERSYGGDVTSQDWYTTRIGRFSALFYNHACGNGLFDNFMSSGLDENKWLVEDGIWTQYSGTLTCYSDVGTIKFKYPYPLLSEYSASGGIYENNNNQYMYGLIEYGKLDVNGSLGVEFGSYKMNIYTTSIWDTVEIYKNGVQLGQYLLLSSLTSGLNDTNTIYFYMDDDMVGFAFASYFSNNLLERTKNNVLLLPGFGVKRSNDTCDGYVKFNTQINGVFLRDFAFMKPICKKDLASLKDFYLYDSFYNLYGDDTAKIGSRYEENNSYPNFLDVHFEDWSSLPNTSYSYFTPSGNSQDFSVPLPKRQAENIQINSLVPVTLNSPFNATIQTVIVDGLTYYPYFGTTTSKYFGINFSATKGILTLPNIVGDGLTINISSFDYVLGGELKTHPGGNYGVVTILGEDPYHEYIYDAYIWVSGDLLFVSDGCRNLNAGEYPGSAGFRIDAFRGYAYNFGPRLSWLGTWNGQNGYNIPVVSGHPPQLFDFNVDATADNQIIMIARVIGLSDGNHFVAPDYSVYPPVSRDHNITPFTQYAPSHYYIGNLSDGYYGLPNFTYMYEGEDKHLIVVVPGSPSGNSSLPKFDFKVNGVSFHKDYHELALPNQSGYFYLGYDDNGNLTYYNDQYPSLPLCLLTREPPKVEYWYLAWRDGYNVDTPHLSGVGFLDINDSVLTYNNNSVSLSPKNKHGGYDVYCWPTSYNINNGFTLASGGDYYYYLRFNSRLDVLPYDGNWDYVNHAKSGHTLVSHISGDILYDDREWVGWGSSGILNFGRNMYFEQKSNDIIAIPKGKIYYINDENVYILNSTQITLPFYISRGITDVGSSCQRESGILYPYLYVNDVGNIELDKGDLWHTIDYFGGTSHRIELGINNLQSNVLCIFELTEYVFSNTFKDASSPVGWPAIFNVDHIRNHYNYYKCAPISNIHAYPNLNNVQGKIYNNLTFSTRNI